MNLSQFIKGVNSLRQRTEATIVKHPTVYRLIENIEKVVVGKSREIELSLVALLSGGHVLLEDVPGVGKTMMVRALAKSVGADYKRIQFTPDLLPSDVTGVSVFSQKTMEFHFRPGPVMSNIVLADEINRTSPKTQAALLEALEEGSVTTDGETRELQQPFMVMATQNPIEYGGTYPLPEAQLDRFLFKFKIGYPSKEEELEVLTRVESHHPISDIQPVLSLEDVLTMKHETKKVVVNNTVKQYIIAIVNATREHGSVYLGASPRASIALMKAGQAFAYMQNREFVIPDDIKYLAPYALQHRVILNSEAKLSSMTNERIIYEVVNQVHVPGGKEIAR
ncbi:MoxR family ATPase [Salipaludibacillus agaradhaerens]|jgi:MoxR-like ATPase|uniref:MoxR family ATPase n=1 Tax=Salipaludibacillus agaradhaerens TaxID=76935 RepID=A0A9Q4FZN6_SALAG|nr:MoxR family ATPase [Salipaludibacillus agaradhaerens]MCR6109624.1 MoxR family ATPase [Bacillus sp. A301a_S52]UJW56760.1 MoxR family ATPase [Bacillus sp. A116_S68]MCR6105538.1 MoxR family ATPase [Salipaludibacillus agaradhaerens]MCR6112895.1 MoxR family ATPase [Salipaludibacillus agaradhaerens]